MHTWGVPALRTAVEKALRRDVSLGHAVGWPRLATRLAPRLAPRLGTHLESQSACRAQDLSFVYDMSDIKDYTPVNELLEKMERKYIFKTGRKVYIPKSFFPTRTLPSDHKKLAG